MHTRPMAGGDGDETAVCWAFPNTRYLRLGQTRTLGATSWGSWKKWEYCPNNGRVVAFKLRVDPYKTKGDNTGLNAIKLLCEQDEQTVKSNAGWYGDWTQWKYCPEGEWMVGGQLKSFTSFGTEDIAAVNFKMMCSGGGKIFDKPLPQCNGS